MRRRIETVCIIAMFAGILLVASVVAVQEQSLGDEVEWTGNGNSGGDWRDGGNWLNGSGHPKYCLQNGVCAFNLCEALVDNRYDPPDYPDIPANNCSGIDILHCFENLTMADGDSEDPVTMTIHSDEVIRLCGFFQVNLRDGGESSSYVKKMGGGRLLAETVIVDGTEGEATLECGAGKITTDYCCCYPTIPGS